MTFKKIVVIGSSCSGKSTLAREIAARIHARHVELDALNWEPGWKMAPDGIYLERVRRAIAVPAWVVDGNYRKSQSTIWPEADLIVWIDLPLPVILKRFFRRSLSRIFPRQVLWNGCRETLRNNIFSRQSLLIWILQNYRRYRREYGAYLIAPPYPHQQVVRLGSAAEVNRFLRDIAPAE